MKNPIVSNWSPRQVGRRPNPFAAFDTVHTLSVTDTPPVPGTDYYREYRFIFNLNSCIILSQEELRSRADISTHIVEDTNRSMSDFVYGDLRKELMGMLVLLYRLPPSQETKEIRESLYKMIDYCDGKEV